MSAGQTFHSKDNAFIPLGPGQTFYETCQVPYLFFFMPLGVSPAGRCSPSDSFHRTAFCLST
jgi:hypothetical protein